MELSPFLSLLDINGVTGTGLVPLFFFVLEETRRGRSFRLLYTTFQISRGEERTEIGRCLTYFLLKALSWFTKRLYQTILV